MSRSHFQRLPVELHLEIMGLLELHDRVNVASANRYFRSITTPPSHADFLHYEASNWARCKQLLTCRGCVRLCGFADFADAMRKTTQCRSGVDAHKRFCIKCGVERGWYRRGTYIAIKTLPHVVCKTCGKLTDQMDRGHNCSSCSPRSWWSCIRVPVQRVEDRDYWTWTARWSPEGRLPREFGDAYPDV